MHSWREIPITLTMPGSDCNRLISALITLAEVFLLSLESEKRKRAGRNSQPFLNASTKNTQYRLTAPQVGRLKVCIFRRASAGFTAEVVVVVAELVQQKLFADYQLRI